ncbi:hypothetical protein [Ferrimonas balearica]|uniref:hypothetical protein n=1 Tax=Ferrimonas balearica TaxID=44012 RepID=UPI001C9946BE|nr:hypothetical protein [Ferrimonas balearica]MBY5993689.1 hypothetical protein [Ferrimonas balearica]
MELCNLIDWHRDRHPGSKNIDNSPKESESWDALRAISDSILLPTEERFGTIEITYGFTSFNLLRYIQGRSPGHMAPNIDQHAAHELNSRGKRICRRGGAACDIWLPQQGNDIRPAARFIASSLPFDRLYFYGDGRPLHVSYGDEHKRQVVLMQTIRGRRMPKVVGLEFFEGN